MCTVPPTHTQRLCPAVGSQRCPGGIPACDCISQCAVCLQRLAGCLHSGARSSQPGPSKKIGGCRYRDHSVAPCKPHQSRHTGLLAADALNMGLRIAYALIYTCWRTRPVMPPLATLRMLAPPPAVTAACLASCVAGCLSSRATLGAWPLDLAAFTATIPTSPLANAVHARRHVLGGALYRTYASKQVWAHIGIHVVLAVPLLACIGLVAWRMQGRALLRVLGMRGKAD